MLGCQTVALEALYAIAQPGMLSLLMVPWKRITSGANAMYSAFRTGPLVPETHMLLLPYITEVDGE